MNIGRLPTRSQYRKMGGYELPEHNDAVKADRTRLVSVVSPFYNEGASLNELSERIVAVRSSCLDVTLC